MNVKVNRTKDEVVINITANTDELAPTVKSTFNRLRGSVSAKGFRPGKAPNNIIERELGAEQVQAEVIDAAAEKFYRQALVEHDIRPIANPHVDVKKFVPYTELELEVKVAVMPEVKLGDYKSISKKPPEAEVSSVEVDEVVTTIRDRLAERQEVERAAREGDEVVIDFHGRKDGADVAGAQAQDYPLLLGSNRFIPGFETELVGLKSGEEKVFKIKFPVEYGEASLAGQEVEFSIKLHKVTELIAPEVNDELAKNAGPFESLAQLRDDVTAHLKSEKEQGLQREFENTVIEAVVESAKVELPQSMLAAERERIAADFDRSLTEQGLTEDEYLKQTKQTEKQHQSALDEQAERRVKTALVLTTVADAEAIEITPEELEIRLQVLAGQYQDEKVQAELQKPEVRREIANQMLAEKTVAKLVEYATGVPESDQADKSTSPKTK
ncbi:MAG: trigger factor [Candidatus Saccharimonadales bacterium]